ncbi:MAG: hypothetical protein QM749_16625 [Aquabacterium sp.]
MDLNFDWDFARILRQLERWPLYSTVAILLLSIGFAVALHATARTLNVGRYGSAGGCASGRRC